MTDLRDFPMKEVALLLGGLVRELARPPSATVPALWFSKNRIPMYQSSRMHSLSDRGDGIGCYASARAPGGRGHGGIVGLFEMGVGSGAGFPDFSGLTGADGEGRGLLEPTRRKRRRA